MEMGIGTGIAISFDFMLPLTEQLNYQAMHSELERVEVTNLVRNRLADMGIPCSDYGQFKQILFVKQCNNCVSCCLQTIALKSAPNYLTSSSIQVAT